MGRLVKLSGDQGFEGSIAPNYGAPKCTKNGAPKRTKNGAPKEPEICPQNKSPFAESKESSNSTTAKSVYDLYG